MDCVPGVEDDGLRLTTTCLCCGPQASELMTRCDAALREDTAMSVAGSEEQESEEGEQWRATRFQVSE